MAAPQVSRNLPHGKDLDDSRFLQLRHAMQAHYSESSPDQSVLFRHYMPDIAKELESTGHTWGSEEGKADDVWQALVHREALKTTGGRMSLCRFQSVIAKAEVKVNEWFVDLLDRSYLAVECDMLQGKKFMERMRIAMPTDEDDGDDCGTTNPTVKTFEQRALRDACQNSVVVSVSLLQSCRTCAS